MLKTIVNKISFILTAGLVLLILCLFVLIVMDKAGVKISAGKPVTEIHLRTAKLKLIAELKKQASEMALLNRTKVVISKK